MLRKQSITPKSTRLCIFTLAHCSRLAILLAACWMNASLVRASDLLVNGSFEQPDLGASNFQVFTSGQTIGSGWVVINGAADVIKSGVNSYGNTWPVSTDGNQLLFLGDNAQATSIYQDVTLSASSNYDLTFDLACLASGSAGSRVQVDILKDNVSIFANPVNFTGPAASVVFINQSLSFQSNSAGVYQLKLIQPGGYYTNIDNMKLTLNVPEPSTYALSLIGAGAMACMARRRKRQEWQASYSQSGKGDSPKRHGLVLMLAFIIPTLLFQQETSAANLLINGDFEAAPILGPGQFDLAVGTSRPIITLASDPNYAWGGISGISGWTYALPFLNGHHSDHGLDKNYESVGSATTNQRAFINNWERRMSQTVNAQQAAGDSVSAEIDFETFGSDSDGGRAGTFYLVAGEADSLNQDLWSSRSIVLAQLKVANPTFQPGTFNPDVTVLNRQPVHLQLNYTFTSNDPALNLPLTIGFRTEWSSVGPTYWDNASLQLSSVPEPSTYALGVIAIGAMAWVARRRKGQQVGV